MGCNILKIIYRIYIYLFIYLYPTYSTSYSNLRQKSFAGCTFQRYLSFLLTFSRSMTERRLRKSKIGRTTNNVHYTKNNYNKTCQMNKAMRGDRIFHLMKRERYNRATLVWLLHVLYFVTTFGDVTRLLTTFHITAPSASAFLRPIHHRPNRVPSSLFRCILTASTSADASSLPNSELDKNESTGNSPQIQQQHYELMYVLGVNLARQLGDIRPLLASPDESEDSKQLYGMELSQVAAGIVDTIIGRIDERQQAALLQQHGSALNALIQDRA